MAEQAGDLGSSKTGLLLRILLPVCVLILGSGAMFGIKMLKKAPGKKTRQPVIRSVEAVPVETGRFQVKFYGYGTIRSSSIIHLAPEVAGRIVSTAPGLENGHIISAGVPLVTLDTTDYELNLASLNAQMKRLNAELKIVKQSQRDNEELFVVRDASRALNQSELSRLKRLLEKDNSVSQATVDAARQRDFAAEERLVLLKQELARIPARTAALEASIEQINVQIKQSLLSIERCKLKAPITGRLQHVQAEPGQLVNRGQVVASMIDDSQLEIEVGLPLESVMKWLPLKRALNGHWLKPNADIRAMLEWVDGPSQASGEAVLDRVSQIDESTRTAKLIFVLTPDADRPVLDGMFCNVTVLGSFVDNAMRIPRAAITTDNQVGVIEDGTFRTKSITLLCTQRNTVLLKSPRPGDVDMLQATDQVITSPSASLIDGQPLRVLSVDK